jgi:zinc/manganese transport system substrate-binding protein
MRLSRRHVLAAPLLALPTPTEAATPLKVVASFSILADLIAQIGGPRVRVTSLVAPDQDLHTFEPRPSDLRAIAEADLMAINGLGLEPWAERLATAANYRKPGLVASRGVQPLIAGQHHHTGGAHDHGAHDHGAYDPHAWQDVANTKRYIANIRDSLAAADPDGAAHYATAATAYLAQLDTLDLDIRAAFLPIPRNRRKVVTSHEAFSYYGDAYDIDFLAPQGLSTAAEPSARELAALIGQIRRENVTALFLENIGSPGLLETVARETKTRIGGQLFSDALTTATGKGPTYLAMMRHNTNTSAAALA